MTVWSSRASMRVDLANLLHRRDRMQAEVDDIEHAIDILDEQIESLRVKVDETPPDPAEVMADLEAAGQTRLFE